MKKTIRLTAILMMAVLMLGLCAVPAFADDDDDIAEVFGYVEDNLYINDYFDFAYMLPDDTFTFATEEELEAVFTTNGVNPSWMEHTFDYAEEQAGSMLEYIKQVYGITDEEIQILRDKYLE